jgi:SAM-dependent methyltransferase
MPYFSDVFRKARWLFVRNIYGDQSSSRRVKKALKFCLAQIKEDDLAINIGAGTTKLHPAIKNIDIYDAPNIDIVASAENLPFENNTIKLVITQEVLEHVQDPFKSMEEITRVLQSGGYLFCQLPFVIGYHPGPTDFWRFTKEGIAELVSRYGLTISKFDFTVGPASGFYRILVEFCATFFSFFLPKSYIFFKSCFALLFYPIKFLDLFLIYSKQADRVAGGYFIIAQKI